MVPREGTHRLLALILRHAEAKSVDDLPRTEVDVRRRASWTGGCRDDCRAAGRCARSRDRADRRCVFPGRSGYRIRSVPACAVLRHALRVLRFQHLHGGGARLVVVAGVVARSCRPRTRHSGSPAESPTPRLDDLRRRRDAVASGRRRPASTARRGARAIRPRRRRRDHDGIQPGVDVACVLRRPPRGGIHPHLARHAVGRSTRAGDTRSHPHAGAGGRCRA